MKSQKELLEELEHLRQVDAEHKAEEQACRLTRDLLRRSEQRLALFLDQTPLAYIEWDACLKVRDWNPAAEKIFGYSRDEVLGKQVFEIIAPKHIQDYVRLVPQLSIKQDTSFECAYENVTKDGRSINCSWHNTPLRDDEGDEESNIVGMASFVQDITAHRQLDERISEHLLQLKQSEKRLLTVVEKNADGIVIVDEESKTVCFANPAGLALFGKTQDELLGSVFAFPLFGDEYADIEIFKPGYVLNAEIRCTRIEWEGRNAWLISLRDVTNRTHRGLEKEVLHRKASELGLLASKQAAAEADEAKNIFLGNMYHELSPSLNAILGTVQLALDGNLDADQRKLLDACRTAAHELTQVVSRILELTRMENDASELVESRFSLRKTLDALFNPFAVQAGLQGLSFTCTVDGNVPDNLNGNVYRLRQVLTRLGTNALRHTRAGAISLKVRLVETTQAVTPSKVTLFFSLRDTGTGIPGEKQKGLFDGFVNQGELGAAGLGLSLCKQLVELMNGTIWVESEPGQGATLLFTADFGLPQEQETSQHPAPLAAPRSRPLKILVAEDDKMSKDLIVLVLQRQGHEVVATQNGPEALKALAKEPFDLVILDIQMPIMDGFQVAKAIRNGQGAITTPNIPIVALTAYALADDRQRFIKSGMNEFVPKPYEVEDLLAAIDRAMVLV